MAKGVLESGNDFIKNTVPLFKENPPKTTSRDIGTLGLSTALLNVIVWAVGLGGIDIPDHVAVSLAAIATYFIARKFQY